MPEQLIFLTEKDLMLYDPQLAGLWGKIKKRIKKSVKRIKKIAPYAAGAVAAFYGGPAAAKAAYAVVGGLTKKKPKPQVIEEVVYEQPIGPPGGPAGPAPLPVIQLPDGTFVRAPVEPAPSVKPITYIGARGLAPQPAMQKMGDFLKSPAGMMAMGVGVVFLMGAMGPKKA